jgi:hypothetical protein
MNLELSTIYQTYIKLPASETDNYLKNISNTYLIDKEYLKKIIREYSKQNDSHNEYIIKQQQLKEYRNEVIKLVNLYVKDAKKIYLLKLLKLGKINDITSYLNEHMNNNPKKSCEISYLIEELQSLYLQLNSKEQYKIYLQSDNCHPIIVNLIALLFCDEEAAILLLKEYQISEINFEIYLEQFKCLFKEQEKDINYLNNIYSKYLEKYVKKDDIFLKQSLELLKDIVNSGYCYEEYLDHHGEYTILQMQNMFKNIKKYGTSEHIQLLNIIMNRDNKQFMEHLKEVAINLYQKEKFDLVDYFQCTKISIPYFKNFINDNMPDISEQVSHQLNLLWNFEHFVYNKIDININIIIEGQVIDLETKQKIISYLETEHIPQTDYTYHYFLKKYKSGELDINAKQKKQTRNL